MKENIIRINAWFTLIFFALMSVVTLLLILFEKSDGYTLFTLFLFVAMTITGLYARNFGLHQFKINYLAKLLAFFAFVFGILFVIGAPAILVNLFGVKESFGAIFTLAIMFIPPVLSSSALLFTKRKVN